MTDHAWVAIQGAVMDGLRDDDVLGHPPQKDQELDSLADMITDHVYAAVSQAGRLPWPARNSHRQVGVRAQVLERGRAPTRPGSSERRRARVPNVPTCHSANSASAPQPSAGVEIPTSIIRARSADRPEVGCDRRTSATPAARGRSRRRLRGPGWSPSCPRSPGRSSARCGRPAQRPSATG